jgi:hypothetical protein
MGKSCIRANMEKLQLGRLVCRTFEHGCDASQEHARVPSCRVDLEHALFNLQHGTATSD